MQDVARRMQEDRVPRNPGHLTENSTLGGDKNPMKLVGTGDSGAIPFTGLRVHLVRTATLVPRGTGKFELSWKSQRGNGRVEDSTPVFAEMAVPGTTFEGAWQENSVDDRDRIFAASNRYAAAQLASHRVYAESSGLSQLGASIEKLQERVSESAGRQDACVLCLGWGGGLLSKVAVTDTSGEGYRQVVRNLTYYQRAVQSGLPFPKTRKIVFEAGQPARVPGWILLEVL